MAENILWPVVNTFSIINVYSSQKSVRSPTYFSHTARCKRESLYPPWRQP